MFERNAVTLIEHAVNFAVTPMETRRAAAPATGQAETPMRSRIASAARGVVLTSTAPAATARDRLRERLAHPRRRMVSRH